VEVELGTDRFSVMVTVQRGFGASSSPRQTRLPGRGQAHPCEEGGLRVKGVYEGVSGMGSPISRQVKDQRGNRSNDKPAADSVEESMTTLDYWQSHAQGVGAYPWSARLGLFVFRHSRSFLSFFGPIDAPDF